MRTWQHMNKNGWPTGEWMSEPDKAQWVDEATGLDCLIVRNHGGALCGYVGVPPEHPAHGKDYSDVDADVHGGLTFADKCDEPSDAAFKRWESRMNANIAEAKGYPRGDAARAIKETGHLVGNYESWRDYMQSSSICHIPEPGQPADVWWFGFDCAHSGDQCPGYMALGRELGMSTFDHGTYKDFDYVKHEVGTLAGQLVKMWPGRA